MGVEVVRQFVPPESQSFTTLPQELVDFYNDHGAQVLLTYAGPQTMVAESQYARFPVLFSELPEDLRQKIRIFFEDPARNNDLLKRGDTIVVYQSYEARDYFRAEFAKRQAAMIEDQDRSAEQLNEIVAKNLDKMNIRKGRGHVRIEQRGTTKISDQAIGGAALAAEVVRVSGKQAK